MADRPANDNERQHVDEVAWMRETKHRREIDARHDLIEAYFPGARLLPPQPPKIETPPTPEEAAAMDRALSGLLKPAPREDLLEKIKREQRERMKRIALGIEEPQREQEQTLDRDDDPRW